MAENKELDDLAQALVKQGLAASYNDGIEKAKQIIGIKEVIEKKRKDFLGGSKEDVDKEVDSIVNPPKQETREQMVEHIKEEVDGVKEELREAETKPEPENVDLIKEKVEDIKDEIEVVEKESEKEGEEKRFQRKERHV